MDEVGIHLDPRDNKTITFKGSKDVKIKKSNNGERRRYSVILCGNNLG